MLFDLQWGEVPDVAVIFLDGAVAREGTAHGDVIDRGFGPSWLIGIEFVDFLAGFAVRVEVSEDEVLVAMVHDLIKDEPEAVTRPNGPRTIEETIHDGTDFLVVVIDIPWVIGMLIIDLLNFFSGKAEDDFILSSCPVGDCFKTKGGKQTWRERKNA